jgi:hypothetical protein
MGQLGFRDEEQRIHKLHQKKSTLTALSEAILWDSFRPLLERRAALNLLRLVGFQSIRADM